MIKGYRVGLHRGSRQPRECGALKKGGVRGLGSGVSVESHMIYSEGSCKSNHVVWDSSLLLDIRAG